MNWYLTLSRANQVFIAVFLAHLLCLSMLGADHWIHRVRVQHKKVSVNTFVATEKPVAKVAPQSPSPQKVQPVQKKVQPKKGAPPSKKKEENLLSDIEKNLENLAIAVPISKKTAIDIPKFNEQPQVEESDSSAAEEIATFLQQMLELPEHGQVKIKLSINRFGGLETLEILESKSQKNEAFLKKRLAEIQFPQLKETISLTIAFTNL